MRKLSPASVMTLGFAALALVIGITQWAAAAQRLDVAQAVGVWHSTERFRGESRVTVAFRKEGGGMVGWATMLGMHRKTDDDATLGFSFCDVRWTDDRFLFKTILPDNEGTTAWEMQLTSGEKATLRAVTENGIPIEGAPAWEMTR
jgi:hypothetical protein